MAFLCVCGLLYRQWFHDDAFFYACVIGCVYFRVNAWVICVEDIQNPGPFGIWAHTESSRAKGIIVPHIRTVQLCRLGEQSCLRDCQTRGQTIAKGRQVWRVGHIKLEEGWQHGHRTAYDRYVGFNRSEPELFFLVRPMTGWQNLHADVGNSTVP